jgi:hypothetical protein
LTYSFSHRNAPWLIAFLLVFIVYQGYELIVAFSWGLLLLTVFNIFIVYLTWREYGIHRARRRRCETIATLRYGLSATAVPSTDASVEPGGLESRAGEAVEAISTPTSAIPPPKAVTMFGGSPRIKANR